MILPFEKSYLIRSFFSLGKLLLLLTFPNIVLLCFAYTFDDPNKDAFEFLATLFGGFLIMLLTDPD